ncbi:glutathione S-transferase family protein [Curvivirga sp.]|uniref:glutathione S-transferase family protein n=1 Tax=Curvivirga sp. TaxID=2856848 RepID=UPI003B59B0D7
MLKLYAIPESLYCAKTRILLRHKNLEWEEILPPGGYGSDEYKTYIPSGNLPALKVDDFTLADSEAIAEYLEQQYPSPACLPSHIRNQAKVRELSRFHDTRLEPCVREFFGIFNGEKLEIPKIQQITQKLNLLVHQLDQLLNEYMSFHNGSLTLADCGFPITFLWVKKLEPYLGIRVPLPPSIQNYLSMAYSIPAVQAELNSYQPILEQFLAEEFQS